MTTAGYVTVWEPVGNGDGVVILTGAAMSMMYVTDATCGEPLLSVAVMVIAYDPETVGVPLMTPPAVIASPVGSPIALQAIGEVPPCWVMVVIGIAMPLTAAGIAGVVIVMPDKSMLSVRFAEADATPGVELSVAVTTTVDDPPAAGVPLNTPAALSAMPAGSPVADHAYGALPPVAVNVVLG